MIQQVDAIYEHGVVRPLKPLSLVESQLVKVMVYDSEAGRADSDWRFLAEIRAEAVALRDVPTLEEVQRAMAKIPGSLTQDFSAEREEW